MSLVVAGRAALATVVVVGAAACSRARSNSAAQGCVPVSGALTADASLAPMAGRFILTLVATAGPRAGQTVAGYLTLRAAPPGAAAPAGNARTALVGGAEIGLESVGALRLGDTGSGDPRAPGVAVYEQRAGAGPPTVTARVGSLITAPPTPGLTQIEGPYTALFVRQIGAAGFAGTWASASGEPGVEARGHFCAVRVTD